MTLEQLIGAALMASIVTSHIEPSGLPKESGYTIGFAVLAVALLIAALAAVRIPVGRRTLTG